MGLSWGSVWHTMDNVSQMLGHTGEDAVKTFAAAPGLAWDLTEPIFTSKNEDYAKAFGNFTGRQFSLLSDTAGATGAILSPVMRESDRLYTQGISEPLSTVLTVLGHAEHGGDPFSGDVWRKAYKDAQTRSIGQSLFLDIAQVNRIPMPSFLSADKNTVAAANVDPLDPKAWKALHDSGPATASIVSGLFDFGTRMRVDPMILAGKGLGVLRKYNRLRPITESDRLAGVQQRAEDQTSKVLKIGRVEVGLQGLATRTDALVGKIQDDKFVPGVIDKYSSGDQLYYAIPELRDSPYGRRIAQILSDTTKGGDNAAAKINARKNILGVLWGDPEAMTNLAKDQETFANLKTKVETAKDLQAYYDKGNGLFSDAMAQGLDEISNIRAQQVLALNKAYLQDEVVKAFAERGYAPPVLAWSGDPAAIARAEKQVGDLKDLGKYLDDNTAQLNRLKDLSNTLDFSPRVSRAGERAAARRIGQPLSRPLVSLYQSSPTSMPLRVVRTLALGTANAPHAFVEKLSAIRPEGMVNLNDIDGTIKEVDAFLAKAGANPNDRADIAARIARSLDSFQRAKIVARAEQIGRQSVAVKHGITDAEEFLSALDRRGAIRRDALMTAYRGRSYSATLKENPTAAETASGATRIDLIDDDGVPVSVPVLDSSQDASIMPMIDMNALDQTYRRYAWAYRAANWQYIQEAKDDAKLAKFAAAGIHAADYGLERFYKLKDPLMSVMDEINRVWKFAQLFRLGYLERVLGDDHMRIAAGFGSETLRKGLQEGMANLWHNDFVSPVWNKHERWMLQSRLHILKDARGTDDLYAVNQRVWAEIARIEKKLGSVKSAGRRTALQQRRDVLLDFHPQNLEEVDAQIKEIEQALKTGTFKQAKGHMGQGTLEVQGQEIPDAYNGAMGETWRQLNSSAGSWAQYGASIESQVHGNLMRTGSFRVYTPSEPHHLEAWAETLNNQFRRSVLVQKVLDGATEEDLVRFIKGTPEGRALARSLPYQGGNPERWAHDVVRMVDQYLPNQEIRDALKKGEVTPTWLGEHFTEAMRPSVHGATVDQSLGTGNISHLIGAQMNRFYRWIGARNDTMSRHPLFVTAYRHEAERQGKIYMEVAKRDGRTEFTGDEINQITEKAREFARHRVNRTLFEMGATTELQHWVRVISPFFGAWREGLDRWWHIIAKDPSAVRKFQLGFDIPRRMGLVVDENGNPVAPGAPISDNHYILLQIPDSWRNGHGHYTSDYKVSEASFNLIFQGGGIFNPGFGPMVQIPANKLAVDNPQYAKTFDAILPLGTQTSAFDMAVPSQWRALWADFAAEHLNHESTQYKQFNAMILPDMMVDFEQAHDGRAPTEAQLNDIIEKANERTIAMARLKAFTGFTSPASVQIQSKFTPQLQAYRRLQDYATAHNKPFFWADKKFIDQYGEAFFPLIGSSALNSSGLSSTEKTVQYIKDNKHLFDVTDPTVYRMIVANAGDGAYSQAARDYLYTHPMQPGSNEPFISLADPRKAVKQQLITQGWFDYDNLTSKLQAAANRMGFASYLDSPILEAQKREAVAVMARNNESWFQDYMTHNDAQYQHNLEFMRVIANDPKLNADPGRTDIKTLQKYLILRDRVQEELNVMGAHGGSASPQALTNRPLLTQFKKAVSSLVESNPTFERYDFNGIIEHDPFLTAVA